MMKKTAVGVVLAMFAGVAAAGDLSEAREYDSSDYSAQVYYRVDFGGERVAQAQSVGLRFDNVRATHYGAPALFQARFGSQGLDRLAISGVDLRGAMLASNQSDGGFMATMTTAQWVGLGLVGVAIAVVVAGEDDSGHVSLGTGTGGN